jgi:hypothetical protein
MTSEGRYDGLENASAVTAGIPGGLLASLRLLAGVLFLADGFIRQRRAAR